MLKHLFCFLLLSTLAAQGEWYVDGVRGNVAQPGVGLASTNPVTRLYSPETSTEFIDGDGYRCVVSNFWEMTFSPDYPRFDTAPSQSLYRFDSLSQGYYESLGGPYYAHKHWSCGYGSSLGSSTPSWYIEYQNALYFACWRPTTNATVLDYWNGGSGMGKAYVNFRSTTTRYDRVSFESGITNSTFPVLIIPLGGEWTDFELWASTNNFKEYPDVWGPGSVYYIHSWGPTACPDDTNVWIYYTDDTAVNSAEWRRAAYFGASDVRTKSIFECLVDPVNAEVASAIVYPSHNCVVAWTNWMSKANHHLTWVYRRWNGVSGEINEISGSKRYNPVVPIEWRTQRTTP